MLENNLMVLAYLKQHPGTADEKLPGSLVWDRDNRAFSEAAWDAAKSSGVTRLMSRDEVAGYEGTYRQLKYISDADDTTWDATNHAERYDLTDSRLSQLDAAQIGEITRLTQIALTKHWLEGVSLQNTAHELKDFRPSISLRELDQIRHLPRFAELMKDPAYGLTISRMRAAGYGPGGTTAAAAGARGGKR